MHMHKSIHFHTHAHLTPFLSLSHQLKCDILIISLPLFIPKTWLASLFFPCPSPTRRSITGTAVFSAQHACITKTEREETGKSGKWWSWVNCSGYYWMGFQPSDNTTCRFVTVTGDTELQTSVIFPHKKMKLYCFKTKTKSCSSRSTICV